MTIELSPEKTITTIVGKDLEHASRLLKEGELVGLPTETVYGLAGNALDGNAVAKIFEVKKRPGFDPLIMHFPSLDRIETYVQSIPAWARKAGEAFWPGPLTLVLPKKATVPDIVSSGHETVGVRVPAHPLTHELLLMLDFPLAAPSANPFGYVSPTTAQHVLDQLRDSVPYVLDGGPSSVGIESTILGEEWGEPVILRLGGIEVERIEEVLGKIEIKNFSTSNPRNPGSLESHYAPRVPLVMGEPDFRRHDPKHIGIISYRESWRDVPRAQQFVLSEKADLREAAQNLFTAMRVLDNMDLEVIFAEELPNVGLGRAMNDRLLRASVKK